MASGIVEKVKTVFTEEMIKGAHGVGIEHSRTFLFRFEIEALYFNSVPTEEGLTEKKIAFFGVVGSATNVVGVGLNLVKTYGCEKPEDYEGGFVSMSAGPATFSLGFDWIGFIWQLWDLELVTDQLLSELKQLRSYVLKNPEEIGEIAPAVLEMTETILDDSQPELKSSRVAANASPQKIEHEPSAIQQWLSPAVKFPFAPPFGELSSLASNLNLQELRKIFQLASDKMSSCHASTIDLIQIAPKKLRELINGPESGKKRRFWRPSLTGYKLLGEVKWKILVSLYDSTTEHIKGLLDRERGYYYDDDIGGALTSRSLRRTDLLDDLVEIQFLMPRRAVQADRYFEQLHDKYPHLIP